MVHTHGNKPTEYHILVAGQLDERWQAWFEGLTVTVTDEGNTLLSGPIADQAALHGVLKRINNLGLTLIAVNPQS